LLRAGADIEAEATYPQGEEPLPKASGGKEKDKKAGKKTVYGQPTYGASITGVTPLHRAARGGHFSTVQALLAHGANVNALTSLQQTALHFAAEGGWEGVVELLLRAGVDIEVEMGMRRRTAVRLAAQAGEEGVMRLIVEERRRRREGGELVVPKDPKGGKRKGSMGGVGKGGVSEPIVNGGYIPPVKGEREGEKLIGKVDGLELDFGMVGDWV
jgi:hypothetical protein